MHTRFWVIKSEEKILLGRPRYRWEDNIKLDLGEIGWSGVDRIQLAQERDLWPALVNMVLKLQVHNYWLLKDLTPWR
jgi:hypothetical protein